MKKGYFELENGEKIEFELYEEEAPNTVKKFVDLVNDTFNDVLTFNSVITCIVSQRGCPDGTGTGGSSKTIKCETEGNPHKHEEGSLSMAHTGKDTGRAQFFIVHEPQPHLDGVHTVFGKVTSGVEHAN